MTVLDHAVIPETAPPVRIERAERGWRLTSEQLVNKPLAEVFPFFADAHNLEAITPAFLKFRVLTPRPIEMKPGLTIDYALKLHGLPMRWRSEIPVWEPPTRFVDQQIKGPYTRWHHEHFFTETAGGTLVIDRVDYEIPGWVLAPLANKLFVEGSLRRIFEHRRQRIEELLG